MFELKIVITLLVTLFLVAGFLGTNESVGGFFDGIAEKLSFSPAGSIEFSLFADNYSDFSFSSKGSINISVDGGTNAALRTGNLRTAKALTVSGFRGSGSVAGRTLSLDGKIAKIELPEITVAVQENMKAESNFTAFTATGIELKTLTIHGTGSLTVKNTTTQFSGDIDITSPSGIFEINRNGRVFYISGKAAKITIPSAGLSIG
jgi:hypothetical protein